MSTIDPTARVEDGAVIGEGTSIGPYCIIGPHVVIGANCKLIAHVHITAQTTIGDDCTIYPFVSLGTPPQSLGYRGELTRLEIGEGCTIREQSTMNAGTVAGGGITRVGDRGYFMNCSHVGHDCMVGNDVIFATSATLGGHCEIGDFVFIGGLSAVHQFTRIGLAGDGRRRLRRARRRDPVRPRQRPVRQARRPQHRRHEAPQVHAASGSPRIRSFYQKLFHGPGMFAERLSAVRPLAATDPAIAEILDFHRCRKTSRAVPAGRPARQTGLMTGPPEP